MVFMRIALFGGTFDPVHWGHLLLAEAARTSFKLDRVLFVPAGQPPHKPSAVASSAHRLRMLRLATASNPGFQVSDWEVRQKRVVYSYETMAHFRSQYPRAALFFVVGSDMFKTVLQWRESDTQLRRCTFLAAERPDVPWATIPAAIRRRARRIEWPGVPLASHEIRRRVQRGESIRYQVTDQVEAYIRTHKLYR
jgi:nicotinate-nucleotide adenylyltransferase